jgi:nitroimidazol reductase NimA-like FMN-containing flavoprotein (pyridoxamine 5'-phosphate oxidase superfamily)
MGMNPQPTHPSVRTLARQECLDLLAVAPIGQLVFTYQAIPDVLPVNVTLAAGMLLIPFASGSPIEGAARNTVVAFHAAKIDERSHLGWSVTVVGRSIELSAHDERLSGGTRPALAWMPGVPDRILGVLLERVTGRRLESEKGFSTNPIDID